MAKNSKRNVTLAVIAIVVVLVFGVKVAVGYFRMNPSRISKSVRTKGDDSAPIKIIEFIDFQCPACAQGAIYLKKFMEDNPGKIQLQMKYFPLSGHKHSLPSSQYAECATQQDKFWPYHDKLVEQQANWAVLENAKPAFDIIAQDVGLDMDVLRQCLSEGAINEIILDDKSEGSKLGIRSTPSYVINGKLTVGQRALKEVLGKNI